MFEQQRRAGTVWRDLIPVNREFCSKLQVKQAAEGCSR